MQNKVVNKKNYPKHTPETVFSRDDLFLKQLCESQTQITSQTLQILSFLTQGLASLNISAYNGFVNRRNLPLLLLLTAIMETGRFFPFML